MMGELILSGMQTPTHNVAVGSQSWEPILIYMQRSQALFSVQKLRSEGLVPSSSGAL